MKKLFSIFAAATLPLLAITLGAIYMTKPAVAITPPDSCFAFNSGTGTITEYYENEGDNPANPTCTRDVDIPATIGGTPVTVVGENAFCNWSSGGVLTVARAFGAMGLDGEGDEEDDSYNSITTVAIPYGVTTIGDRAFCGNSLTSADIPNSVTSIGEEAFASNKLTSVAIPDSITSIGYGAFSFNQLTSITIPDSVTYMGYRAFTDNQLSSLTLGGSLENIEWESFSNNQLSSVIIPSSVTNIESNAFANNQLTSVIIPSSLQYIGDGAFDMQHPGLSLSTEDMFAIEDGDTELLSQLIDSLVYVALNTPDGSNPHNLQHSVGFGCAEYDDEWNCLNAYVTGGYLINPAKLTLGYKNKNGQSIKSSQTFTGQNQGSYLIDYSASNVDLPTPEYTNFQTLEEQAAIATALNNAFFMVGDEVTLTPPAISGYTTPAPKTFTLSNPETVGDFVYQPVGDGSSGGSTDPQPKPLTKVDFSTPSGSSTNPTKDSVPSGIAPALSQSTLTLDETKDCSTIDQARLLAPTGFTAPASDYTTLGGLDFTLSCSEPGKDAILTLSLKGEVDNTATVKVYKKTSNGTVTDITTHTTISTQNNRTTITYNLVDGGDLDDDHTVNGQIVDPIYVAVPEGSALASGTLADTGENTPLVAAAAGLLILTGLAAVIFSLRHKHA